MKSVRMLKSIGLLAVGLLAISCTRSVEDKTQITLRVPTTLGGFSKANNSLGSMNLNNAKLDFVAINIRKGSGSPKTYDFEYRDSGVTGGHADIVIDNPPVGTGWNIQYLGVYEGADGNKIFTYDDNYSQGESLINITSGKVTNVSLQAQIFSNASKEGQVMGRYFDSSDSGPTGELTMKFKPPTNAPEMEIENSWEIWSGWFSIYAFDNSSVGFSYYLKGSSTPLFKNVSLSNVNNDTNHPLYVSGSDYHAVRVSIPAGYDVDHDFNGSGSAPLAAASAEELNIGFFESSGAAASVTSKNVCVPSYSESMMNRWQDAAGNNHMIYDLGGTLGTDITISGGYEASYGGVLLDGSCDEAQMIINNVIRVYANRLSDREGDAIGMRGPFALMNSASRHGGFMDLSYDGTYIDLKWRYMPGVELLTAQGKVGASVYAKKEFGGSGGGGHGDFNCEEVAALEGYKFIGDTSNAFYNDFAGINTDLVTSSNYHDFRFMVCPYRLVNGEREYGYESISESCVGGCGDNEHFGWGVTDADLTGASLREIYSGAAWTGKHADSARVTSFNNSSTEYTQLNYSVPYSGGSSLDAVTGDEIMVMVVAEGSDSDCGTYNGDNIGPGYRNFSRLLYSSSGIAKIHKGTFLDNLTGTTGLSATATAGGPFCWVEVVSIPHFKNLIFGDGDGFTSLPINLSNSYATPGLFFRVNGTLTADGGSFLKVTDNGFAGSSGTLYFGAGIGGDSGAASTQSGGQGDAADAGGGGGYGDGGDGDGIGGESYCSGGCSGSSSYGVRHNLISGGGGGDSGGFSGGRGGGVIMAYIKNLTLSDDSTIEATGANGQSGGAGGGGAGSVNLVIGQFNSNGHILNINAIGGNGAGTGSGGGGGWTSLGLCQMASGTTISNVVDNTAGGSSGGSAGQMGGNELIVHDPSNGGQQISACRRD